MLFRVGAFEGIARCGLLLAQELADGLEVAAGGHADIPTDDPFRGVGEPGLDGFVRAFFAEMEDLGLYFPQLRFCGRVGVVGGGFNSSSGSDSSSDEECECGDDGFHVVW